MQDKVIASIALKLNDYDTLVSLYDVEEMAQSIAAAIAPLVEEQIKFKYAIGQDVWVENGSVFTKCTVKYIHIQQGAEPGKVLVRYEMNVFSGWYRESEVYETKEAAMADNR